MLHQQPMYLQSTMPSPTRKEEYPSSSSLHSSPTATTSSSHNDLLDPKSLRYQVVMEAPTAAAQKLNESPLTYLNKGQTYNITIKDTQQMEGYMTSTIMIMFHDEDHRKTAPNYWKFWQTQQSNPQMARAIDIEHTKSSGLYQVECHSFDRITFRWLGNKGAHLLIRFNCLSTDFSRIKGVKGIPLRLHMETSDATGHILERSYCRIKLFRDKGAERKNKDDAKNIERQLEKLRGKHGEPHPLWLTFSHAVPFTVFNKVDPKDVATLYDNITTTTTTTTASSSSSSSSSYPRYSSNITTRTSMSSPIPPPLPLPLPVSSNTIPYTSLSMPLMTTTTTTNSPPLVSSSSSSHPHHQHQQQKRHYRYLTDPGYSLQGHHHHHHPTPMSTTATATATTTNNLFQSPPPPPPPLSMIPFHNTNPWLASPVDVDPTYTPQKRLRAAKRSLFVRFDSQPTYRAIYLNELTVQELKTKLVEKMVLMDPMMSPQEDTKVTLMRQVANKPQELLVCIDEDAIVQDMPEEQDMVVQKRIKQQEDGDEEDDDGSMTLILLY